MPSRSRALFYYSLGNGTAKALIYALALCSLAMSATWPIPLLAQPIADQADASDAAKHAPECGTPPDETRMRLVRTDGEWQIQVHGSKWVTVTRTLHEPMHLVGSQDGAHLAYLSTEEQGVVRLRIQSVVDGRPWSGDLSRAPRRICFSPDGSSLLVFSASGAATAVPLEVLDD